ncbi:hypothetical protein DFH06DRAFT_1445393 [Mycena polygramma]|nr:hypothetical protein DFH06DRAFT_1445393 [Mycena polygramma]
MLFKNFVFAACALALVDAAAIGVVRDIPAEDPVTSPNGGIVPYRRAPNGGDGGIYGRDIPAEDPVTSPNGGIVPYKRGGVSAGGASSAPNGGSGGIYGRDVPAEDPVTSPNGGIIPYE